MAFSLHYQPLCHVALRHGFHLNDGATEFDDLSAAHQRRALRGFDIFDDLTLSVLPDTRRTLANLDLLVRPRPTGFFVAQAIRETAPGVFVPARLPQRAVRLRFALRECAPFFWNYTNLSLDARRRTVYYLSNRAGQKGGTFPDLSAPAPVYDAGAVYQAGDVVRKGPAAVVSYLAARTGAHAAPAVGDPNWIKLASRNYVDHADRVALHPQGFAFGLPAGRLTEVHVGLDAQDGTAHALGSATAPAGQTLHAFQVNARGLPPGRYDLTVAGRDTAGDPYAHTDPVYLDDALATQRVFAVVELFHLPGEVLGPFRLYDEAAGHRLLQPTYRVLLLNRHTYWRYRFRTEPAAGTPLGDLERVGGDYVTKAALPLTRRFTEVNFDGAKLLPNPSPRALSPAPDRIYSDVPVYLNP